MFSVHHQESSTVYTAIGICHTGYAVRLLAGTGWNSPVWHIPMAVYTVLDSWWWTENLSETCKVLFQKQIWEISASRWFYCKNISRCTVLWMSNCFCHLHTIFLRLLLLMSENLQWSRLDWCKCMRASSPVRYPFIHFHYIVPIIMHF
jgi:hypothetical protein